MVRDFEMPIFRICLHRLYARYPCGQQRLTGLLGPVYIDSDVEGFKTISVNYGKNYLS